MRYFLQSGEVYWESEMQIFLQCIQTEVRAQAPARMALGRVTEVGPTFRHSCCSGDNPETWNRPLPLSRPRLLLKLTILSVASVIVVAEVC